MARHGLQLVKSARPDVLEPEVVDGKGDVAASPETKGWLSPAVAQDIMRLANKFVDGRHEIDVIRANSDADVEKIEKEIERVVADAKAYVDKVRADSEAWHQKHDEKRRLVESVLSRLDANHPEWSDEVRKKILDVALAAINAS